MEQIRKINYKSDFDFAVILRGADGEEVKWPGVPFTIGLYCGRAKYVAKSDGAGNTVNCYRDGDDRIHVVCDAHGLNPGRLMMEFRCDIPDAIYPDGTRRDVNRIYLPIELVTGAGDGFDATATPSVPVIPVTGEPGKTPDDYEYLPDEYVVVDAGGNEIGYDDATGTIIDG